MVPGTQAFATLTFRCSSMCSLMSNKARSHRSLSPKRLPWDRQHPLTLSSCPSAEFKTNMMYIIARVELPSSLVVTKTTCCAELFTPNRTSESHDYLTVETYIKLLSNRRNLFLSFGFSRFSCRATWPRQRSSTFYKLKRKKPTW